MIKLVSQNDLRVKGSYDALAHIRQRKMLQLRERHEAGLGVCESEIAQVIFDSILQTRTGFHQIEDEDDCYEWTDFLYDEIDGDYEKIFEFDFDIIASCYQRLYDEWLNDMRKKIAKASSLVDVAELVGFVDSMSIDSSNEFLEGILGQIQIKRSDLKDFKVFGSDANFMIVSDGDEVFLCQIVAHN